jgi:hypothetical protein
MLQCHSSRNAGEYGGFDQDNIRRLSVIIKTMLGEWILCRRSSSKFVTIRSDYD